jgi:two-component sensor histidine kinase
MDGNVGEFGCGRLRHRIRQLELRLQEAHHRVANSLQLVSSLADHEARAIQDPAARLRLVSTRRHVEAIAQVHRLLSLDAEGDRVALHDYLARLASGLQASVAGADATRLVATTCDPYFVAPEIAVCFGMIVNELVANALKYAYADARGEVRIRFAAPETGGFTLIVEDDGAALREGDLLSGSGVGARMVDAMARRLGADFRLQAGPRGGRAIVCGAARPEP